MEAEGFDVLRGAEARTRSTRVASQPLPCRDPSARAGARSRAPADSVLFKASFRGRALFNGPEPSQRFFAGARKKWEGERAAAPRSSFPYFPFALPYAPFLLSGGLRPLSLCFSGVWRAELFRKPRCLAGCRARIERERERDGERPKRSDCIVALASASTPARVPAVALYFSLSLSVPVAAGDLRCAFHEARHVAARRPQSPQARSTARAKATFH